MPPIPTPVVAAVEMGYGHLRAAQPLADVLGCEIVHADRPPMADASEAALWMRTRSLYERTSRGTGIPLLGRGVNALLDFVTAIDHLHPYRDQSRPNHQVRALVRAMDRGLGRGLARHLATTGRPLLTTYFIAALAAERHGCPDVWCLVTDADLARAWVAPDPARSRIRYLAPTRRALRRLQSYGVAAERLSYTGFPLPPQLVGGPEMEILRANLAARLVRLDPGGSLRERRGREAESLVGTLPAEQEGVAPLVTFAVGGSGAQASLAPQILTGLRRELLEGRLCLALVAGIRPEVARSFHEAIRATDLESCLGTSVEVVHESTFGAYYRRFNDVLARTDVLWTKSSELTFYGALGLPLVLSWPVGVHERYNRRWARERGVALPMGNPRHAGEWLTEWLEEGVLAAAALSGFLHLPARGTQRVLEEVGMGERAPGS